MNKINLVGRLVRDPELKFAAGSGMAIGNFTIAVNRRFKKEGQPEADFIPIVCFSKIAEAVANYTAKGKLISVSGAMQVRNYEAKDGTKKYVTEVIADEVNFLEWRDKDQVSSSQEAELTPVDDGDIPF